MSLSKTLEITIDGVRYVPEADSYYSLHETLPQALARHMDIEAWLTRANTTLQEKCEVLEARLKSIALLSAARPIHETVAARTDPVQRTKSTQRCVDKGWWEQ